MFRLSVVVNIGPCTLPSLYCMAILIAVVRSLTMEVWTNSERTLHANIVVIVIKNIIIFVIVSGLRDTIKNFCSCSSEQAHVGVQSN